MTTFNLRRSMSESILSDLDFKNKMAWVWTTLKTSFRYYLEWYPLITLSLYKFFVIFRTKIRIYKKVSRNWTPENDWTECQTGRFYNLYKIGEIANFNLTSRYVSITLFDIYSPSSWNHRTDGAMESALHWSSLDCQLSREDVL